MPVPEDPGGTPVGRPGRLGRWWREHVVLVDSLWVVVLLVPSLLWLVALGVSGGYGPALLAQTVLSVVLLVPLAWRRVAPGVVAGGLAVLQVGQLLSGLVDETGVLPANVFATLSAVFTVTAHARRDRTWQVYLAVALLGCALLGVLVQSGLGLTAATAVLGAALAGYLRRIVRVRDEAAVERARRLEVERDSAAAVAAADERRRIARDLHDVIAHSLTVVVAQADGGRYAARTDPTAAVEALRTVSVTGRAALADLRAALGALRDTDGARTDPLPGAGDVPVLVDRVRASGADVRLTLLGDTAAVPAATGLTVYRVVQESLTNALKHAGPGTGVEVRVEVGEGVEVHVVDDGLGSAAPVADGTGLGVVGMRERVRALGGELVAGPRAGGGWVVRASLPLPPGTGGTGGTSGTDVTSGTSGTADPDRPGVRR
ncbi:sensor histidine kinase [Aquipuribacter sp. SD81]|uniref:sensor histidine kinase n=1 Tax=Aquipuribacter sp. SD81 TaxID=3127703 RepID=UPI003019CF13